MQNRLVNLNLLNNIIGKTKQHCSLDQSTKSAHESERNMQYISCPLVLIQTNKLPHELTSTSIDNSVLTMSGR